MTSTSKTGSLDASSHPDRFTGHAGRDRLDGLSLLICSLLGLVKGLLAIVFRGEIVHGTLPGGLFGGEAGSHLLLTLLLLTLLLELLQCLFGGRLSKFVVTVVMR